MVEVTQADRSAAAAYWKVSRIGNGETQRRYLAGESDQSFIVQAFAAHRLAARAELLAELSEPTEAMVEAGLASQQINMDAANQSDFVLSQRMLLWIAFRAMIAKAGE